MFKNWLLLSLLSTILVIPAWLAIPFFKNNFGIRPEIFLIYYFIGVVLFTTGVMLPHPDELLPLGPLLLPIIGIIGIGVLLGGPTNFLLFRAIMLAPNQALPVAIASMSSIGVFAAAIIVGKTLPNYFPQATFNIYHLIGTLLATAAVIVFSLAPNK